MIDRPIHRYPTRRRGFTLVELMVSITIGLFLIGGLLTIITTMKRTTGAQSNIGQLQDNVRLATGLLTDTIESTGDYVASGTSSPVGTNPGSAFPALTITANGQAFNFAKGQSILGIGAAGAPAPGDMIGVRYMTSGTDKLTNCVGNTSTVPVTWVNIFSIDANGNLQCQVTTINAGGTIVSTVTATLVSGVSNMSITYGLRTNTSVTGNSIDTYLDSVGVNALPTGGANPPLWSNIQSVKINLTFVLANLPNQAGAPTTIPVMRVIDVMNQNGVDT